MKIKVNIKQIGKKKNSIQEVSYDIPFAPHCVGELIEGVVTSCVETYNQRLESSEILRCLTMKEIEDRASSGKVSFGVNYGEKKAELQPAVENALQSFEDGIYRIFIDDRSVEELDEKILIDENSSLTFVRLVMLAGRMW